MFKFVIVLCAVLFASEANDFSEAPREANEFDWSSGSIQIVPLQPPVMSTKTEKATVMNLEELEVKYNSSRDNWLAATQYMSMAMLYYSASVSNKIMSAEKMYRNKLQDVKGYIDATESYRNRSLEIISRISEAYSSELQQKLISHVQVVLDGVEDLICQAGNANVSVCKAYSNNLTTSLNPEGEGMRLLLRFSGCSSPVVAKAMLSADKVDRELKGEVERINDVWKNGSNCTADECDKITRIIARAGIVLVNIVKDEMNEIASIFRNLPKIQANCLETSGLEAYHKYLENVLKKTKRCIRRRTYKNHDVGVD